jgi:probable HAF family extracellular repeat protein
MRRTLTTLLLPLAVVCLGAGLPAETDGRRDLGAAIRYSRYTVTEIGTFGGPSSEAWGINNPGQVVGRAELPPDSGGNVYYHAFLFQGGVMTDLGTIQPGCNPGNSNSWAFDINDAGQVAGRTCSNSRDPRAFRWSGGVMVDLGTLGGTLSQARGINDAGDVVGTAAMPLDGATHAFVYRNNVMQDLGTIDGGQHSEAHHINDNGKVVGYSEHHPPPNREAHAFLYSNNVMTDLTPAITCCSWAWGINNADKVIGHATGGLFGRDNVGFLYSNGTLTDLGSLSGGYTWAYSINDQDEIVGFSAVGSGFHAFLYEGGVMVDLNNFIPANPEWELNYATSINDVGQIAGIGTVGGHIRGFLLTPVQTAPTAVDDAYTTPFQVPLVVAAPGVLANDYGSGMSSMIAGLVTTPTHGVLALNQNGGFTYTPASGFTGLDTFTYRAINITGPSNLATVSLTVGQPSMVQAPTNLYTYSIVDSSVTLRWVPPSAGPRPTGYTVEGGVNPSEVLAIISTGSAYPIYTFAAPTGSFYVRVHALAGTSKSAASNEIRLHVRVPVPPSPSASLTAVVNGSNVNLAWRNTFSGGAPTGVFLDAQTGSGVVSFPLGLTDSFGAGGVPAGTYTLKLWAVNAGGISGPSNQVVVTVPGACSGPPLQPTSFLAYAIGRTIFVIWDPPTTGPAAVSYELMVGGAFVGRFPTAGRALSGTVAPGSYDLSVVAQNACGSSSATPTQAVTIP